MCLTVIGADITFAGGVEVVAVVVGAVGVVVVGEDDCEVFEACVDVGATAATGATFVA